MIGWEQWKVEANDRNGSGKGEVKYVAVARIMWHRTSVASAVAGNVPDRERQGRTEEDW